MAGPLGTRIVANCGRLASTTKSYASGAKVIANGIAEVAAWNRFAAIPLKLGHSP